MGRDIEDNFDPYVPHPGDEVKCSSCPTNKIVDEIAKCNFTCEGGPLKTHRGYMELLARVHQLEDVTSATHCIWFKNIFNPILRAIQMWTDRPYVIVTMVKGNEIVGYGFRRVKLKE